MLKFVVSRKTTCISVSLVRNINAAFMREGIKQRRRVAPVSADQAGIQDCSL